MKIRLIILFVLFLTHFQILLAQEPAKKILVIHSYHVTLPWTVSIMEGLASAKKQHNIECFNEYLDTVRLTDSISRENHTGYLKEKYKSITFDAVIGDSNVASHFIAQYGEFLGDIPRVFYTGFAFVNSPNTYCLISQYREAIVKTLDLALLQNPGAENWWLSIVKTQPVT